MAIDQRPQVQDRRTGLTRARRRQQIRTDQAQDFVHPRKPQQQGRPQRMQRKGGFCYVQRPEGHSRASASAATRTERVNSRHRSRSRRSCALVSGSAALIDAAYLQRQPPGRSRKTGPGRMRGAAGCWASSRSSPHRVVGGEVAIDEQPVMAVPRHRRRSRRHPVRQKRPGRRMVEAIVRRRHWIAKQRNFSRYCAHGIFERTARSRRRFHGSVALDRPRSSS